MPDLGAELLDASRSEETVVEQTKLLAEAQAQLQREAVAIFRANGAQVIAGWRPTVMAAFEQIRDAARTVPVGCADAAAFNAPPELQASWRQAQAALRVGVPG